MGGAPCWKLQEPTTAALRKHANRVSCTDLRAKSSAASDEQRRQNDSLRRAETPAAPVPQASGSQTSTNPLEIKSHGSSVRGESSSGEASGGGVASPLWPQDCSVSVGDVTWRHAALPRVTPSALPISSLIAAAPWRFSDTTKNDDEVDSTSQHRRSPATSTSCRSSSSVTFAQTVRILRDRPVVFDRAFHNHGEADDDELAFDTTSEMPLPQQCAFAGDESAERCSDTSAATHNPQIKHPSISSGELEPALILDSSAVEVAPCIENQPPRAPRNVPWGQNTLVLLDEHCADGINNALHPEFRRVRPLGQPTAPISRNSTTLVVTPSDGSASPVRVRVRLLGSSLTLLPSEGVGET